MNNDISFGSPFVSNLSLEFPGDGAPRRSIKSEMHAKINLRIRTSVKIDERYETVIDLTISFEPDDADSEYKGNITVSTLCESQADLDDADIDSKREILSTIANEQYGYGKAMISLLTSSCYRTPMYLPVVDFKSATENFISEQNKKKDE